MARFLERRLDGLEAVAGARPLIVFIQNMSVWDSGRPDHLTTTSGSHRWTRTDTEDAEGFRARAAEAACATSRAAMVVLMESSAAMSAEERS